MQRIGFIINILNDIYGLVKKGYLRKDIKYKVDITEYRKSKTDEQLALYNATLMQIQKVMFASTGLTRNRLHNMLLNELGILATKNGEPIVKRINANYDYMSDSQLHLKSIRTFTNRNGKEMRECYVLKESKHFNTEEFKSLIDALVGFIIDNELQNKIDVSYLRDLAKHKK